VPIVIAPLDAGSTLRVIWQIIAAVTSVNATFLGSIEDRLKQ
jgi:hypothetical protein